MRRRRRTRGTWFPVIGMPTTNEANPDDSSAGFDFQLQVPGDASSDILVTEVTFDAPLETTDASVTENTRLADFIGQEYLMSRILGNVFLAKAALPTDIGGGTARNAVMVTAGFFVARADGTDASDPVGGTTITEAIREYSPENRDNIREPWMWRRKWILGNAMSPYINTFVTAPSDLSMSHNFPSSNVYYASMHNNSWVDIKTKRRVTGDERLWFVVTAHNWPWVNQNDGGAANTTQVNGHVDLRMFGSLRKARNRSNF